MTQTIAGVLPILHTPFTADDEIDRDSFQRQIDWAFSVGADGVCLAMVSELLRLTTADQRYRVCAIALLSVAALPLLTGLLPHWRLHP